MLIINNAMFKSHAHYSYGRINNAQTNILSKTCIVHTNITSIFD